MSLNKRIILYISIIFLVLTALNYLISNKFYFNELYELENRAIFNTTNKIAYALQNKHEAFKDFVIDWAHWDDTYNYINDKNQEFIDSNMPDSTFIDNKLDLIIITDLSGKIIFKKAYDRSSLKERELPTDFNDLLKNETRISSFKELDDSFCGFVKYEGKPFYIVSVPVLTSNNKGPINGALIMGRSIDNHDIQQIKNVSDPSLQMFDLNNMNLNADLIEISSDIKDELPLIKILNKNYINGFIQFYDIYKKPLILFSIKSKREIFLQGKQSFKLYFIMYLIGSIIVIIVMIYVLQKFILLRLSVLSKEVGYIAEKKDFSARISITGNDELSKTKKDINNMLGKLEESINEVNTLSGLLPICSFCKKIRDDKGYWDKIESYFEKKTDINFSHSLCPACFKKKYPEAYENYQKENPDNTK